MPSPRSPAVVSPRFTTTFIGREDLSSRLLASIAEHPITILLGPPGVGKSRLVAELCRRSPARTAWCDLGGAAGEDDLAARLADAVGARLVGEQTSIFEALGEALRPVERVVLDDAEGLSRVLPDFLAELHAAAPNARFVITSRVRAELTGAALVEVPPLDVSPGGEAEELFIARARLVRPDLTPGPREREDLSALVRALDGLPLAIEIAAARSRFVAVSALAEHMRAALHAPGEMPLGAAIERSLEQLPDDLRSVFARLSVFRGGFSLEAAQAVLCADAGGTPLLEALAELADRSLVGTRIAGSAPRFSMLNAVRAVAERRLDPASAQALRERHASFFADLCERLAREDGIGSLSVRRALSVERDNLSAALEHARARGSPACLMLEVAWAALHEQTGPLLGVYTTLERALSERPSAPLATRALAAVTLGNLARELDRPADVLEVARLISAEAEGATPGANAGDPVILGAFALAEVARGQALTALGRFDEGGRALSLARDVERRLGRTLFEARALHAFGVNRLEMGRLGEARLSLREALGLVGDRDAALLGRLLAMLGVIEIEEGRLDEARDCLSRARPLAEEAGALWLCAVVTTNSAVVSHEGGDLDTAVAEYERAAGLCRAAGLRRGEALARAFVGNCHIERGAYRAARAAYEDALVRLAKEGWRHTMVLAPYAAAAAMDGDLELARRTLDEAEASLRSMGQERLALTVPVWRGFLDLAEADHLRARGDDAGALLRVESAREKARSTLVDPTPGPVSASGPSLAQQSTDMRAALRALRRALAQRAPHETPAAAWEVKVDGSLVITPSGERVDLGKRAALRRVVARLAKERVARPGAVLRVEDLVMAGWPGEEVSAKMGADRVYAAIATLRKLGLGALQSTGDGYRLDPSISFRIGK